VKKLVLELTSKNAPFSEPLGAPKIKLKVHYFVVNILFKKVTASVITASVLVK